MGQGYTFLHDFLGSARAYQKNSSMQNIICMDDNQNLFNFMHIPLQEKYATGFLIHKQYPYHYNAYQSYNKP